MSLGKYFCSSSAIQPLTLTCSIVESLPQDYEPRLEFVDETVGGSIPPNFMEAVRKVRDTKIDKEASLKLNYQSLSPIGIFGGL